jgi:DNA topoisomerase III
MWKRVITPAEEKRGAHWWGCSGFPECKKTYPDIKGKPDYNIKKQQGGSHD